MKLERLLVSMVFVTFVLCLGPALEAGTITEGFDNFQNGVRPWGWEFIGCNENTDADMVNYGIAPPAVRLDELGDAIRTIEYTPTGVATPELTFYLQALDLNPSSSLLVREYDIDPAVAGWTTLTEIEEISLAGATIGPLDLNPSTSQRVEFFYNKLDAADIVIDDVEITNVEPVEPADPPFLVLDYTDFTGDGQADIAIFRPSTGLWAVRDLGRVYFGAAGDIPVSGDYTGDGVASVAIFRPSTGLWAVKDVARAYFGNDGDIPAPNDYTGDGIADIAVFQPSTGRWAVRHVTRAYFGREDDLPVPGDYTGSGYSQIAVFRPDTGLWAVRDVTRAYFGAEGDWPVPGVYDWYGGTKASPFRSQIAIFRPSTGLWAIRGLTRAYFGTTGDAPVVGNFGPGALDHPGIFRQTTGLWAIRGITRAYFGGIEDIPLAR